LVPLYFVEEIDFYLKVERDYIIDISDIFTVLPFTFKSLMYLG
jgi:hypothetical protein